MDNFKCSCGMVVRLGTSVEEQIKHINGAYHKKKLLQRKVYGDG